MSFRPLEPDEQAHKLREQLQKATIVLDQPPPTHEAVEEAAPARRSGKFAGVVNQLLIMFWNLRPSTRKAEIQPQTPPMMGVPHGVTDALVYAEGIFVTRQKGRPQIRFCNSHSYLALQSSLKGADNGVYPTESCISLGCDIPPDGTHTARMRVSVNGQLCVRIEAFDVSRSEVQELASV